MDKVSGKGPKNQSIKTKQNNKQPRKKHFVLLVEYRAN